MIWTENGTPGVNLGMPCELEVDLIVPSFILGWERRQKWVLFQYDLEKKTARHKR